MRKSSFITLELDFIINVNECHSKKSGFNLTVEAALIYDSDELFLFI